MKRRLLHWDAPDKSDFLNVDIDIEDDRPSVIVEEGNYETRGREVTMEVRDGGDLAVLCYPLDRDEPVVVILKAFGGFEVRDNGE